MPNVDDLIERTFGYFARSEPPATKEEPKAAPQTDPVELAARAVLEAVEAHKGLPKPVEHWKPVAAKVLGLQRLYEKRWQGVLKEGTEKGLFRIDTDSHAHPVLVSMAQDAPPEERRSAPEESDWNPPSYFPCGHLSWSASKDHDLARQEGFCCHDGRMKRPVNYQRLAGDYIRPIPERFRRTEERQTSMGWPGLCCHPETHLYIGGNTNNCLHENPKGPWCAVHAKLRKSV